LNLGTAGQEVDLKQKKKKEEKRAKTKQKRRSKQSKNVNFMLMSSKAKTRALKTTTITSDVQGSPNRKDIPGTVLEKLFRKSTMEAIGTVLKRGIAKTVTVANMHAAKDHLMMEVRLRMMLLLVGGVDSLEAACDSLPARYTQEHVTQVISDAVVPATKTKELPTYAEIVKIVNVGHKLTKEQEERFLKTLPVTVKDLATRLKRSVDLNNSRSSASADVDEGMITLDDNDFEEGARDQVRILKITLPQELVDLYGGPAFRQVMVLNTNACDMNFLSKVWPRDKKFTACKFSVGFGWNMFENDAEPTPKEDMKKMVDNFMLLNKDATHCVMRITTAPLLIGDATYAMKEFHNVPGDMHVVVW
jgi:hypothetical protein